MKIRKTSIKLLLLGILFLGVAILFSRASYEIYKQEFRVCELERDEKARLLREKGETVFIISHGFCRKKHNFADYPTYTFLALSVLTISASIIFRKK